jgi:phosphatidylglycerophosphate synthase
MKLSLKEIKDKCIEDRFFEYDSWQDRLFVPPAIYVSWVCLRVGISGNAVSWISGLVAVIGGYLLTFKDSSIVLAGSLGYILWYFLDYVDGAVARLNEKGSVAGQYIDWMMHVISHVAIVSGIALGALSSVGNWILPFVILGIIAACLPYARFSMAWFSICMEQQQRRVKGLAVEMNHDFTAPPKKYGYCYKYIRGLSIVIFHENYLIFTLPIFALLELLNVFVLFDLRVIFTVLAGTLYFFVQVLEIHRLVVNNKIQKAYAELFSPNHKPNLPDDHFLN